MVPVRIKTCAKHRLNKSALNSFADTNSLSAHFLKFVQTFNRADPEFLHLGCEKERFVLSFYFNSTYVNWEGLPDGIFAYQQSQFWYILQCLGMKNFGIFYGNLVFSYIAIRYLYGNLVRFMAVWYMFFCYFVYFLPFGILYQEKIWQPFSWKWLKNADHSLQARLGHFTPIVPDQCPLVKWRQ
jgi:hypothetical protein